MRSYNKIKNKNGAGKLRAVHFRSPQIGNGQSTLKKNCSNLQRHRFLAIAYQTVWILRVNQYDWTEDENLSFWDIKIVTLH